MLTKRIIPCLDVTLDRAGGCVVKGVEFVDLKEAGDPVELAKRYNEDGADELVFLDITASAHGRETMIDVIERTADEVFIPPLTVGGAASARLKLSARSSEQVLIRFLLIHQQLKILNLSKNLPTYSEPSALLLPLTASEIPM